MNRIRTSTRLLSNSQLSVGRWKNLFNQNRAQMSRGDDGLFFLHIWSLLQQQNIPISYLSGHHHRYRFTQTISVQLVQTKYFASVDIDSSFREHTKTSLWRSTRILTQVMDVRAFTTDFVITDVAVALRRKEDGFLFLRFSRIMVRQCYFSPLCIPTHKVKWFIAIFRNL